MANRKRLTKSKRGQFLSILRDCGTVTAAAKSIGITRQAAYLAKDKYPTFALEWEQAIESATDKLVDVAVERASKANGSDALLMFLLRGHRPSVYAPERALGKRCHDTGLFDFCRMGHGGCGTAGGGGNLGRGN